MPNPTFDYDERLSEDEKEALCLFIERRFRYTVTLRRIGNDPNRYVLDFAPDFTNPSYYGLEVS